MRYCDTAVVLSVCTTLVRIDTFETSHSISSSLEGCTSWTNQAVFNPVNFFQPRILLTGQPLLACLLS